MASRYWVGGSGTWNSSSTANWSASSGGSAGASIPTSADDVFFDASSGTLAVTVTTTAYCRTLTFTGSSGTFTVNDTIPVNVFGGLTLSSNVTYNLAAGSYFDFYSTVTGNTITTNGKTLANMSFVGTGDWAFQDDVVVSGFIDVRKGTLKTNGKTVTAKFLFSNVTSFARSIEFGASTINITQSVYFNSTNLTINAGTSNIVFTGTNQAITFYGASFTYYKVTVDTMVTSLAISGSNIINQFIASGSNTQINFASGTVTSVTNWSVSSTNTVGIKLRSTNPGSQYEIEKLGGGTVSVTGLDIQDCLGYPASTWTAYSSINSGNNTNWTFATTPSSGAFFALL